MSASPKADMAAEFDVLDGVPDKKRGMGVIICLYDKKMYLRENLIAWLNQLQSILMEKFCRKNS